MPLLYISKEIFNLAVDFRVLSWGCECFVIETMNLDEMTKSQWRTRVEGTRPNLEETTFNDV